MAEQFKNKTGSRGIQWCDRTVIRGLIARCTQLPDSVCKAMIEDGDLAVGRVAEDRLMQ
jgi:hypothetical protein